MTDRCPDRCPACCHRQPCTPRMARRSSRELVADYLCHHCGHVWSTSWAIDRAA